MKVTYLLSDSRKDGSRNTLGSREDRKERVRFCVGVIILVVCRIRSPESVNEKRVVLYKETTIMLK